MNPQFSEIDALFVEIQDYIDPPKRSSALTKTEQAVNLDERRQGSQSFEEKYKAVAEKLRAALSHSTAEDVIEAFGNGCRLMKIGLSGYITNNFKPDFVPLMIESIRTSGNQTGLIARANSFFLQSLADQLGDAIAPLVLDALDLVGVREQALLVTEQLMLREALPKIKALSTFPDSYISHIAKNVQLALEN